MEKGQLRLVLGVCLVLGSVLSARVATATDPSVRTYATLSHQEFSDAMVKHGGYLWMARGPEGQVEIHRGGSRIATVGMGFWPTHLYPFGHDAIFVIGKSNANGWKAHYATISTKTLRITMNKSFSTSANVVRELYREASGASTVMTVFPDDFLGKPGKLYFSNMGSQSIVHAGSVYTSHLKPKLFGPSEGMMIGDAIYVVEKPGMGMGNLARVNVADQSITRLWPGPHATLKHLVYLPSFARLVVSEGPAHKVHFIDPDALKITDSIDVDGYPAGSTQVGRCLAVVVAGAKRQVAFYDLYHPTKRLVDTWDLSAAGNQFDAPSTVMMDYTTSTLYVRSLHPMPATYTGPSLNLTVALTASPADKKAGKDPISVCVQ